VKDPDREGVERRTVEPGPSFFSSPTTTVPLPPSIQKAQFQSLGRHIDPTAFSEIQSDFSDFQGRGSKARKEFSSSTKESAEFQPVCPFPELFLEPISSQVHGGWASGISLLRFGPLVCLGRAWELATLMAREPRL